MATVTLTGNIAKINLLKDNRILLSLAENSEFTDKTSGETMKSTQWFSLVIKCKQNQLPYQVGDLVKVTDAHLHCTISYDEMSRAYLNQYVNCKLEQIRLLHRKQNKTPF